MNKNRIFMGIKIFGLTFLLVLLIILAYRATLFTPSVWLKSIAGKQTFGIAVNVSSHPGKKGYYLVTAKEGKVYIFKEGSEIKKTILDMVSEVKSNTTEEGMLSAIIDPLNLKEIYIYYSMNKIDPLTNRLSRFRLDKEDNVVRESEEILFELTKSNTSHNGGNMLFGPDGLFYFGFGDGSFASKDMPSKLDSSLWGSIIRIDVRKRENNKQYSIPEDNPFYGHESIPSEVWAYGFRNPWRWSFVDKNTIIVGDVGENTHEEIDIVKKGDHLGWPYVEGGKCAANYPNCNLKKYKPPMTYFSRMVSRSVTGGYVYRGSKIENLKGKYVFGDYLRGMMTLNYPEAPKFVKDIKDDALEIIFPKIPINFGPDIGRTIHPVSFYEDENKELLMVALNGGIFRIIPIDFWTKIRAFFYMYGSFR